HGACATTSSPCTTLFRCLLANNETPFALQRMLWCRVSAGSYMRRCSEGTPVNNGVLILHNWMHRSRLAYACALTGMTAISRILRSEDHTSELQSLAYLVC